MTLHTPSRALEANIRLLGGWTNLEGVTPERLGDEHWPLFLTGWRVESHATTHCGATSTRSPTGTRSPYSPAGRSVGQRSETRQRSLFGAIEHCSPALLRDVDRINAAHAHYRTGSSRFYRPPPPPMNVKPR